ncbi:MAG: hypothetical protein A2020_14275 [Lentisphaerae bacterium GWF2_45_14]|nr:MAG: hypothetical protein A2020_14275 [Lentisphaerae bacterium GWF2_45_14]
MKIKLNYIKSLAILAFAILLGSNGCRSYRPIPECVKSDTLTGTESEIKKVIPQACQILTLRIAEDIALVNNPDFISKHQAMLAAWERYYQSLGDFLPTVNASYGYTSDYANPSVQKNLQGTANANRSVSRGNSVGLQGQWLVFNGLIREMNALAEKHKAKEYEYAEEDARRLLLRSVSTQYNNVLLAIEKNRIARTNMEFQQKLLDETQLKYEAGAVPLSDVLNFKIKLNEAEGSLISAEYQYNTSKFALAELMGIPEGKLPDDTKFPPMSASTGEQLADVSIYIDTALSNRPDLKKYREALEAANYTLYSRWGAYSPSVSLNGSLGWSRDKSRYDGRYGDSLEGSSNWDTIDQRATAGYGVSADWTVFDGFKRFTRIREARSLVSQGEFELANSWIQVIQEVRSAYEGYIQNKKQAILFKKTLGLVTKQRDLVEEEYKAGNTELTRLNEAQRDLVNADTNLVSALINVQNAKAQLEASTNSR